MAALIAAATAVLSLMRGEGTFVGMRTIDEEVQLMAQAVAEAHRKQS
jgi:hypothetical protein